MIFAVVAVPGSAQARQLHLRAGPAAAAFVRQEGNPAEPYTCRAGAPTQSFMIVNEVDVPPACLAKVERGAADPSLDTNDAHGECQTAATCALWSVTADD